MEGGPCGPEGRIDFHSEGPGGEVSPGAEPEQGKWRQLLNLKVNEFPN